MKKVLKKEGLTWVLRYRVGRKEQTPIVVGLVADFPKKDDAAEEVDRLQTTLHLYTDEDLDEMIAAQEKFLDAEGFEDGGVQ